MTDRQPSAHDIVIHDAMFKPIAGGKVLVADDNKQGVEIMLALLEDEGSPTKAVVLRAGFLALRRIADFFAIPYDPDPHFPELPISVTREEFDTACARLEAQGADVKSVASGGAVCAGVEFKEHDVIAGKIDHGLVEAHGQAGSGQGWI